MYIIDFMKKKKVSVSVPEEEVQTRVQEMLPEVVPMEGSLMKSF